MVALAVLMDASHHAHAIWTVSGWKRLPTAPFINRPAVPRPPVRGGFPL